MVHALDARPPRTTERASPAAIDERATTLVIGLGNPIRGDDGVGWRVADTLRTRLSSSDDVDVDTLAVGGLRLMEHLLGYQRAVIIDAMSTGAVALGEVRVFWLDAFDERGGGHVTSPHDTSLGMAVRLARRLGAEVPDDIRIVGVETAPVFDFSEMLSPEVARAIPVACELALEIARAKGKEARRGIA